MKSGLWHLEMETRDRLLSFGFPILLLALWQEAGSSARPLGPAVRRLIRRPALRG